MKMQKFLITLAGSSILAGSSLIAYAVDNKSSHKPFDGITVEHAVSINQLPEEVESGSIKLDDSDENKMASLAQLKAQFAIDIAEMAFKGKVVEVQLGEENGYLIWHVTNLTNDGKELNLMIDAGNGRLLAAEQETRFHNEDSDKDNVSFFNDLNDKKTTEGKIWEQNSES